jgi:hypothetical protein
MSNRRVEAFLLRVVVQEGAVSDDEVLRGRIKHIGSGDERHFHCIEEALTFIREQFNGDFARLTVDIDEREAV